MQWLVQEGRKVKAVDISTLKENAGPFNPQYYNRVEYMDALRAVDRANPTDPFAVMRAKNLLDRGILRPSDIKAGVSV